MKSNSVKLAVIGLFIILAAAVCSAVSANSEGIYVDEVRFSENGQSIYTIKDGNISAMATVRNETGSEKKVSIIECAYYENRLSGVDCRIVSVKPSQIKEVALDDLSVRADGSFKVLAWDEEYSPITKPIALTDVSCEKKVDAASVTADGVTYQGYVYDFARKIDFYPVVKTYGIPQEFKSAEPLISSSTGDVVAETSGAQDMTNALAYKVYAADGTYARYTVRTYPLSYHFGDTCNYWLSGCTPNGSHNPGAGAWSTNMTTNNTYANIAFKSSNGDYYFNLSRNDKNDNSSYYRLTRADWGGSYSDATEQHRILLKVDSASENPGFVIATAKNEFAFSAGSEEGKIAVYSVNNNKNLILDSTECEKIGEIEAGKWITIDIITKNYLASQSSGTTLGNTYMFVDGKLFYRTSTNKRGARTDLISNDADLTGIINFYGLPNSEFDVSFDDISVSKASRANIETIDSNYGPY